MNGELLSVLEYIEREKGIKREVLISAVESALVSAARKVLHQKKNREAEEEEDISVKLDPKTGGIKIFSEGKEIASAEFGRIAAQTAKQVIIQKIREAERDVIFDEFAARKNSIITGAVHRFDKGDIIVDTGRTEAVLPRAELMPREHYKQGERVKAYVLDVQRSPKGTHILLSRKHEGMIKKLFELEVPEIASGVVEIKSIAREPGDRTKMAVISKDEKVDAVGACVGMRGQRVKNIVNELQGEKIDIVRYSDDMKDYIKEALKPAEILDIKVNKELKQAEVLVSDDQLSLAIGKKGQNVKLASRLVGYALNVKSKASIAEQEAKRAAVKEAEEAKEASEAIEISALPGVGPKAEKALVEAGFKTMKDVAKASVEDLIKIKGIGKKTAEKIIDAAKELKG